MFLNESMTLCILAAVMRETAIFIARFVDSKYCLSIVEFQTVLEHNYGSSTKTKLCVLIEYIWYFPSLIVFFSLMIAIQFNTDSLFF